MTIRWCLPMLALALAGGCKRKTNTLNDISRFEGMIEGKAQAEGFKGKADCPEGVSIEDGASFDCTLDVESGQRYVVTATMTVKDGRFHVESVYAGNPVITGLMIEDLEPAIRGKTGKAATITCAEPLLVPSESGEVRCDATVDDEPRRLVVVFNDVREIQSWKLEPR